MTRLAQTERHALCDTLAAVGPDAPTLCGEWRTGDLLAHLLVREGRPDLAAGIVLPRFAARTEAAMTRVRTAPFEESLARLRHGPPRWHPTHLAHLDESANLVEMFVHHEDVLRAGHTGARRSLSPAMSAALGRRLGVMARVLLRGATDDVSLVGPTRIRVGRRGGPAVEVHGGAGELLLFAYGRQAVADVELAGPPEAVERLRLAPLGI